MGVRGKSPFRDYILILIGASIMGFAIKNIYDPIGLVTGGASGVAIILKKQVRGCSKAKGLELYQADTSGYGHAVGFPLCDSGDAVSDG